MYVEKTKAGPLLVAVLPWKTRMNPEGVMGKVAGANVVLEVLEDIVVVDCGGVLP